MKRILARPRLATFALYALLAVAHTWPLATAPGRLSRNDNADTVLNEWIVAWVQHQALRDPRHLFDANIFYPERATLAYSEPLIVPAAIGAPLRWLGASPVLVYNVLILAGLTLTGWTGCLLVWRWTGDPMAGIIAGIVFAFNAHTLTRLPQLQALHVEFLPLALLAFDQVLTMPDPNRLRQGTAVRPSDAKAEGAGALLLALWFVLEGLTSYYALILTTTALVAGVCVRPRDWWGERGRSVRPRLALAAGIAVVVLLPFLLPYKRLGQVRELDEVALYSATWRDYLSTPARAHYDTWSARWFGGPTALFPGVTPLALALVASVTGTAVRDRRARVALAFGLAGAALSFGPAMPGYALLYRLLPPLQGIRNAARFGYLAIIGCAILAGFGVATIRSRWRGARWMPALLAALFIGVNLDAWSAPIAYLDAERVSPLYARLRESSAIVAEFPFYPPDRVFRHAPYMLHATSHWRPMLNGYSGVIPASFLAHARELAHFPDARSIAALRAAGVTHVFVNDRALRDWTDNETADAVPRSPELRLLASDAGVALYALREPSALSHQPSAISPQPSAMTPDRQSPQPSAISHQP